MNGASTPNIQLQIFAAVFYGGSSLLIMFVNKIALTTFGFPSAHFLAFAQFVATLFLLYLLRACSVIK